MKAYIVDTNDLQKNIKTLVSKAGKTPVIAVLKGNGYGLGLLPMARLCQECGIRHFAVTEVAEVEALRNAGFQKEAILMLRPTCDSDEVRRLLAAEATLTVSSQDDASVLNGIAAQMELVADVHLKIDVGMGRYGFLPSEADKIANLFAYMDALAISGIYAHLPCAFCSKKQTMAQAEAFRGLLKTLHDQGYETGMAHLCNSAAFLRYPELKMDGVRLGSSLLGRASVRSNFGLIRIGRCETTVEELRWLPKGATCGYGSAWKAKRPTRIAVLPVGWYHGFSCEMGNDIFRFRDGLRMMFRGLKTALLPKNIYVTVNGQRCRTLGHIGMLHTVCDVSRITCALGDKAVLDINPLMLKGMNVIYK